MSSFLESLDSHKFLTRTYVDITKSKIISTEQPTDEPKELSIQRAINEASTYKVFSANGEVNHLYTLPMSIPVSRYKQLEKTYDRKQKYHRSMLGFVSEEKQRTENFLASLCTSDNKSKKQSFTLAIVAIVSIFTASSSSAAGGDVEAAIAQISGNQPLDLLSQEV